MQKTIRPRSIKAELSEQFTAQEMGTDSPINMTPHNNGVCTMYCNFETSNALFIFVYFTTSLFG